MKKFIFTLMILLTASFAYGQTSPEAYLAKMPDAPKKACGLASADKETFLKSVRHLKDEMDKDLSSRQEETQIYVDANREKIAAGLAPQPASAEKLTGKGGKLTKEEKKARAEQMMRQYGMSPDDVKKLKAARKEDRATLGQAYGDKVAKQTDTTAPDVAGSAKSIQEMQIEQKSLLERVDARNAGILPRFKTLDQTAAAAKAKDLDPLQRQLTQMGGIVVSKEQSDRIDKLALKLKNAQKQYCETYSPQYTALLGEYLTAIKASFADYSRLETILAKTQMGLDKPIDAQVGFYGIKALRDYADMLSKVCKFDLPCDY